MKKHGMTYKDIEMQYIADTFELSNAFIAGQLDAIAIIEPYATKCKTATGGSFLGDGIDIYGQGYPDCVLMGQKKIIAKEHEVVKNVIRAFFDAEYQIETNIDEAAKLMVGKYYKTDMASLLSAAKASRRASTSATSGSSCSVALRACGSSTTSARIRWTS